MVLQHNNRIRRRSGKQVIRETQAPKLAVMPNRKPTEADIRQRAHEIYLARGGMPGNAQLNWLQAEIEVRAHAGLPAHGA